MSIIRELLVKIRGDSSSLEQATTKAKEVLGGLGTRAVAAGRVLGTALAAGATAAATAFGFLARSGLAYGDMLDKISKQTGISTEAIGSLKYAAEQSGVEFGALTSSINLMRKNLAEAAVSGGPLVDTLNRIGLSSGDLSRLTPEEQFRKITGALQELGPGALQTNAAFDIFGRGAAALMPIIQSGTATLAEMEAKAKQLGLALNSTDTAALDAAGDSIASMQGSVQGLGNAVGIELAPYIQMGAEAFRDYFFIPLQTDLPKLFNAFLDFASGTELTIRRLSIKMGAFFKAGIAGIVENGIEALQGFIGWAERQLDSLPFVKLDGKSNVGGENLAAAKRARAEAEKAVADAEAMKAEDTWAGRMRKRAEEMRKGYEEEGKKADKARADAAKNAGKGATPAAASTKEKSTKEKKADEKIIWNDEFDRQWEEMSKRARETALNAMGPAQRGVEKYIDTLREARKNNEDWANVATKAMQGFEDTLVKAATTGKLSFKDMFNSIAADIARVLIRRSVTEPLGNALSGFINSAAGAYFGAPTGARAIGGPVMGGQPYLVGEKGPELFVPSTSGGIVPNGKLGGGGQQVIVQQSLNFGLGVQQGVRQELAAMMPQIMAQTQQGVQVAIERGGTLSRSVGRR